MCGICGLLEHDPAASAEPAILGAMNAVLTHRGPDSAGCAAMGPAGMAMSRLSIIDLAGGEQPIWNENGKLCIVYNGELYNFLKLRPQLEDLGHVFRTQTDTEVVLHAYEEWGPLCLHRFNGMFAFAIWNEQSQEMFLCRDRIGEKPLYYYRDRKRLVFASEIKSILAHPHVRRELHLPGLVNFLAFGHAVAPETIYQGISKLLPGHYLVARRDTVEIVRYWDIGDQPQLPHDTVPSEAECASRIRELLDDAVRLRMVADVPLGAFLSGGVDSGAIVALMKRHSTGPVKTFSLGFTGGSAYNELSDARRLANYLGTDHHELHAEHVDLVETLRTLVYHYDEPFGDEAGFAIYVLSQFAREQVKVVLTGDGGDEIFGGYRRYVVDQAAPLYQRLPASLTRQALPAGVDLLPRLRRSKRSLQTLPIRDSATRYAAWMSFFSPAIRAELLQAAVLQDVHDHDPSWSYPRYYHALNHGAANDHLNRLMYVDLKSWLPDVYLEKTDKASMACSLEARLPLLDYRLAELAFQIPGKYKIRGWSTKRVFKQAVRDLLPPDVLSKRKHGFAVPLDPWFRGGLSAFTFEVLLDQRARQRGYFNTDVVERLWREHKEGRHVWDQQLWLLVNFELWHRIYLDGDPV